MPLAHRGHHRRREAHSLGSVRANLFQRSEEVPEMFKRLFFAVLGFWLLKKYVKPYFDDRRDTAAIDET
jgi:hypothetical protein